MKYEAWRWSQRAEEEFRKSLDKLLPMFDKIAKAAKGNIDTYTQSMSKFQASEGFINFVNKACKRMVTPLARANYETWRKAARNRTRSSLIYRSLLKEINDGLKSDIQSQIMHNASLIRTLPNDVAQKVVVDIRDWALAGERATTIAEIIRDKTAQHARASAKLIARTEVGKTSTALTRARSENLGLNWYVWRTAQDENRVRKSHRIMEGVLIKWADPPSPERLANEKDVGNYHAGEIWNCRCYAEPLLEIDDVRWPAKVHVNGQIQRMSKSKFEEIM